MFLILCTFEGYTAFRAPSMINPGRRSHPPISAPRGRWRKPLLTHQRGSRNEAASAHCSHNPASFRERGRKYALRWSADTLAQG